MLEATKLIVAVKNIETPDERHPLAMFGCAPRSKVAVPGICWGRVFSTGRLKG